MLRRIFEIITIFICYTVFMAVAKPVFAVFNCDFTLSEQMSALWHGLPMDMSMAGYLTVAPALLAIVSLWAKGCARVLASVYFAISAVLVSLATVSNIVLYSHWGFPLDTTPLFYVSTGLEAALASAPWWVWAAAIAIILALATILWRVLAVIWRLFTKDAPVIYPPSRRFATSAGLLVLSGLLIIPIRGGFTVSTMNLSRAYFSSDMRLNHTAVNPLFSFFYSATHSTRLSDEFRFMDRATADSIMAELKEHSDSVPRLPFKPHIQLILMESFSSHLLPSLGGESIAVRLDSLGREGLMFSNIYASSFRTDRALPAVLNGYPALPTTSLMKFVDKLDSLPSLGRALRDNGYATRYYYGGDANFTNMRALLVAGGYEQIVSDQDFPLQQRLSKWGAHDDVLFARALSDAQTDGNGRPTLSVIQTSSSHEPFEVPFRGRHADERANAFDYADSCLWQYVQELKQLPSYDSTLLVITPDHYGAYPADLTDHQQRHRIPVILAGGALRHLADLDSLKRDPMLGQIGAQTDIAATVLGLLGIDHSMFRFSNNLFSPDRRKFAFFSEPSWIGLKTPQGFAEINVDTKATEQGNDSIINILRAYAQSLYDDAAAR